MTGTYNGNLLDGTLKKFPAGTNVPRIGRIKLGTESNGGFKNIAISNCVFEGCHGLALEGDRASAPQDGKVLQHDVVAIFQRDGLVASAGCFREIVIRVAGAPVLLQPFAPEETRSANAEIVDVFSPDQAVVPMRMPVVLVCMPGLIGFGCIVAAGTSIGRCRRGQNGGARSRNNVT